jgi:hypothetical protein
MVNAVLERLYRDGEVVHRDGRRMPVAPPGILPQRGAYLFELVKQLRPAVTLETGFAYGMSALFLAEALRQNGGGRHIAIDPFASSRFDGLGLAHLEEAGLGTIVTLYEEPSELCLPRLVTEGLRVDFAFVDGHHLFDYVVTECLFSGSCCDGAACWSSTTAISRPSGGPATSSRRTEATSRRSPKPHARASCGGCFAVRSRLPPLLRLFRRVADDDPRDWNHFAPF